ncbi:MAG: archaeoflavoprotein AfpA [Archaeoglobaceae archaeon]
MAQQQGRDENKKKVVWGITGSGDKLSETFEVMKTLREEYEDRIDIRVYLSKAGEQVIKYYKLIKPLKESFSDYKVEKNANSPFLAGQLQLGNYDFFLIAPATSNTVAKMAMGIADSLMSNSAIMGMKAFTPVYIMPSDYKEGTVVTTLPSGREMKLRIRKEDVEHVKTLQNMDGVTVLENPQDIIDLFRQQLGEPNSTSDSTSDSTSGQNNA